MISATERAEIITAGQEDGQRLFMVSTAIYKSLIILNYVLGVIGSLAGLGMLIGGMAARYGGGTFALAGLAILVVTAVVCAINYAVAVLSTHVAKVLVHLLFANLAIMEQGAK